MASILSSATDARSTLHQMLQLLSLSWIVPDVCSWLPWNNLLEKTSALQHQSLSQMLPYKVFWLPKFNMVKNKNVPKYFRIIRFKIMNCFCCCGLVCTWVELSFDLHSHISDESLQRRRYTCVTSPYTLVVDNWTEQLIWYWTTQLVLDNLHPTKMQLIIWKRINLPSFLIV